MRALLGLGLALAACNGTTDPDEVECGTGTMLQGTQCIAPALTCGPGTHDDGGSCVADDQRFIIRTTHEVVADHDRPAPVVVFGRNPDGTPATDAIVLNTSRAGAGTFDPPTLTLGDRGGKAHFVPCDHDTPGCTGPVEITAALASAPTTPIARFPLDLVAPPAVGSVENCLGGGNVLYIEGSSNFVYPGAITLANATFTRAGGDQRGFVEIVPTDPMQGKKWSFEISTIGLNLPIAVGTYYDANQFPATGKPALNVTTDSPYKDCTYSYQGEFEVHEFVYTTSLQRMTVSFRQWCGLPTRMISGCVHIE